MLSAHYFSIWTLSIFYRFVHAIFLRRIRYIFPSKMSEIFILKTGIDYSYQEISFLIPISLSDQEIP